MGQAFLKSSFPSPLAGEGGLARRAETDEGPPQPHQVRSSQRIKTFAKSLRRNATDVERKMWSVLRDRRFDGFKFRRQVPIGPYIADFACFEARLVVELDGSQHGNTNRDVARDRWLAEDGYRVLRFWNTDVTMKRAAVLETIWSELQTQKTPSSGAARHLLPRGEKGVPTEGSGQ